MKLGLLADVHGNSLALYNCLKVLEREGMDQLIFIGDALGYLPMGLEVLKQLNESKAICLMGNHEAMLLGKLSLRKDQDEVYGLKMILTELSFELREQIAHWPSIKEQSLDGRRLIFVHGSPWDHLNGYIYPDSNLSCFPSLGVSFVFMGHTHRPFIKRVEETLVVNVGSCGLPRDDGCLSSFAIFDTSTGNCDILRVPFDIQSVLTKASRPIHPLIRSLFARKERGKPFGIIIN